MTESTDAIGNVWENHREYPWRERRAGARVVLEAKKDMPAGTRLCACVDPDNRHRMLFWLPDGLVAYAEEMEPVQNTTNRIK